MTKPIKTIEVEADVDDLLAVVLQWVFYACIGLFLWSMALLAHQVVGWLQHAEWQQIPFGVLFISQQGQEALTAYPEGPLRWVPAWGNMLVIDAVAYNLSPTAYGVQKISMWFLHEPLVTVVDLLCLGLGFWVASLSGDLEKRIGNKKLAATKAAQDLKP